MKTSIINLHAATEADDLRCGDGEIENSSIIFGGGNSGGDTSGGEGPSADNRTITLRDSVTVPEDSTLLAVHPADDGGCRLILYTSNNLLGYIEVRKDGYSDNALHIINAAPAKARKVTACGDWLLYLTDTAIEYYLRKADRYMRLGEAPAAPVGVPLAAERALPPYSYYENESVEIAVAVSVGSDDARGVLDWLAGTADTVSAVTRSNIQNAVGEALADFLKAVEGASLCFWPVKAALCYRLADGTAWKAGGTQTLHSEFGQLRLEIRQATCSDGILRMILVPDRRPFAVELPEKAPEIPGEWKEIIAGIQVLTQKEVDIDPGYISRPVTLSGGKRGFLAGQKNVGAPDPAEGVAGDLCTGGVPDNIFTLGDTVTAVRGNTLLTSRAALPPVTGGEARVSGGRILHLTQSLRPLSSGQFGQFPLYAFSADGIRALTPSGGSYRDVQLLARDVAFGADSFAPLPGATGFISPAGVMKIEGTSVTELSKNLNLDWNENMRLVYLYRDNSLLLYTPGGSANLYDLTSGKWSDVKTAIDERHYGWPKAWVKTGSKIGEAAVEATAVMKAKAVSADTPTAIKTRPIKLGNAFEIKKITEVRAQWPDGSRLPLKLYGAMNLKKWYFLGLAREGDMINCGSGWRYFRIETFAISNGEEYLLPQIFIKFAT